MTASDATVATMRMRGVDTELVTRAQHGDRAAFGLLAADIATRFLAVSRRILRDLDLAEVHGWAARLTSGPDPRRTCSPRTYGDHPTLRAAGSLRHDFHPESPTRHS